MAETVQALSLYEGFFSGGARILHTEVILGMQNSGQSHSVLSIHDRVHREDTVQPIEEDPCYIKLTEAGVAVNSLGRRFVGQQPDTSSFKDDELDAFRTAIGDANLILSLKEQPLGLIKKAGRLGRPIIACLHRSDPENQGAAALKNLRHGIEHGAIAACTINAHAAKDAYVAAGIPESKIHVIPNGIDLDRFQPSPGKRAMIRYSMQIPDEVPVVLYAARFDAMKDVPLFMASAREYLGSNPDAYVMACGAGMADSNPAMKRLLGDAFGGAMHLLERIRLLGVRKDMDYLYAASDIVSSTSLFGETYPLVLLEGMACGAIPVATAVGDTDKMLDQQRGIITPRDPVKIAKAWGQAYAHKGRLGVPPSERHTIGHHSMLQDYKALFTEYALRP